MIAFVKGTLEYINEDKAVIDVNGIGMNVIVSTKTIAELPMTGNEVKLYTYTALREDSISLYGFLSRDELSLFKKLISVNGIGPKGGLALLSAISCEDLKFAILSGDVKLISSAPGIGKKTAERVILDLKDKISYDIEHIDLEIRRSNETSVEGSDIQKEAVRALTALGYSAAEAQKAVKNVQDTDTDVESILKEALKYLL